MPAPVRIEFPRKALKKDDKAMNKNKLSEIIRVVCGLSNSKGGRVILYSVDGNYSEGDVDNITKKVEQKLYSLYGHSLADEILTRETVTDTEIGFHVMPSSQLGTLNYNVYHAGETQVTQVPSSTPKDKVMDIIEGTSRKRKLREHTGIGEHHKHFVLGKTVALRESRTTQFKKLKDENSENCDIASRMKSNGLTSCVSAFASGNGGHIYYGIRVTEDGLNTVEGQTVDNPEKLVKEVEKIITKMIWPTKYGNPKKGEHWDIFFEPVLGADEKNPKYVIVISVAPSSKAVFAGEPESYREVSGKIIKMSYVEWNKRFYQHQISERSEAAGVGRNVGRCGWSSSHARNENFAINNKLVQLRNDGDKRGFMKYIKELQGSDSCDAIIISQQQEAGYFIRQGDFKKAEELLEKNKRFLTTSKNAAILEVRCLYWVCVSKRSQCGSLGVSEEIFVSAMQKMQSIPPSLVGPWLFVQKARILETKISDRCETKEDDCLISECKASYIEALREASVLEDSLAVVALKQRTHISLARVLLGCFRRRDKVIRKEACSEEDFKEADAMLGIVDQSRNLQGWPITQLCKCEYLLARCEQDVGNWRRVHDRHFLKEARSKSEEAVKIAREIDFKFLCAFASEQLTYVENMLKRDGCTDTCESRRGDRL